MTSVYPFKARWHLFILFINFEGNNMIIKKLWWFFRLEKARYLIGILSLSFVSILNLIPPKVMGQVIDSIDAKNLNFKKYFCAFRKLSRFES